MEILHNTTTDHYFHANNHDYELSGIYDESYPDGILDTPYGKTPIEADNVEEIVGLAEKLIEVLETSYNLNGMNDTIHNFNSIVDSVLW